MFCMSGWPESSDFNDIGSQSICYVRLDAPNHMFWMILEAKSYVLDDPDITTLARSCVLADPKHMTLARSYVLDYPNHMLCMFGFRLFPKRMCVRKFEEKYERFAGEGWANRRVLDAAFWIYF